MTTRLQTLKQYLKEANPERDRLYIEDLKISIEYEKKRVGKGFLANEEISVQGHS